MSNIFWVWLAASVVFLILELMTPTLIFACFVVASIVAGIFSWFVPEAYYWQIGVFIAMAIVLLPLTRTLAKKITHASPQKSNVDALIGKIALVTKAIDPDLGGQVRIEGEIWSALATEQIDESAKVKVMSLSGTKVHVEKIS